MRVHLAKNTSPQPFSEPKNRGLGISQRTQLHASAQEGV